MNTRYPDIKVAAATAIIARTISERLILRQQKRRFRAACLLELAKVLQRRFNLKTPGFEQSLGDIFRIFVTARPLVHVTGPDFVERAVDAGEGRLGGAGRLTHDAPLFSLIHAGNARNGRA